MLGNSLIGQVAKGLVTIERMHLVLQILSSQAFIIEQCPKVIAIR
jgi:hypothetical protein